MKLKGALRRALEKKLEERREYKKYYNETYEHERPKALRERAMKDAKADAYGRNRGKYGRTKSTLGYLGQMGKNLADSPYGMGSGGLFGPSPKKKKKKNKKAKTITINLRR